MFIDFILKRKIELCRQNPNNSITFCTDNTVLSCNVVSLSNRSFIILSAGHTGNAVNNVVTSWEQRHSPGWRVTLLTLSTKSLVLCIWYGDLTIKGFMYLSQHFSYPIGNWASARYYGPEENAGFMDLWKSIKLWGGASCGIHVFVDAVF